ncbi:ATP-binding protein [Abyssalbus ytuae]|uniref:Tetratricopeptide repeat protein n=1 Tax=Abyssalbus ytuae TaxID=2926907 RepID=A0A9E7CTM8_9FLAO|nr:tetratricopeptide repeat protein [Abyssalbus ytuae]UOB18326.1 tetratricopeptide repeat protein [Abyssalbus ytuae]
MINKDFKKILFILLLTTNIVVSQSGFETDLKMLYRRGNEICSSNDKEQVFCKAFDFYLKKEFDSCFIYSGKALSEEKNKEEQDVLNYIQGVSAIKKKLFKRALLNINKIDDVSNLKNLKYLKLGQIYLNLEEYDKAIFNYLKWEKNNITTEIKLKKNAYHNLGVCYLHKGDYINAKKKFSKELELIKPTDTLEIISAKIDLANIYYNQYNDEEAIPLFKEAYQLAKNFSNIELKQLTANNMAVVEKNRKNYEESVNYYIEYEKWKDSIWNRDKIWELAEKDKALTLQLNEEKLTAEKLKQKVTLLIAFISIIGGGLVLSFSIQLKRKNHKITTQKKYLDDLNATKDKLFTILSHDLKTPVYFLSNKLLSLITEEKKKEVKSIEGIQECYIIASNTSLLIENTLHWALNNRDKLLFKISTLNLRIVVDQVLYYFEPVIELKRIELIIQIPEVCNVLADYNTFKILLRNILDNAVKFTPEKSTIFISTYECEEKITLTIENPISRNVVFENVNTLYNSTGLGHQLCEEFAKKNGGTFEVLKSPSNFQILVTLIKNHINDIVSI